MIVQYKFDLLKNVDFVVTIILLNIDRQYVSDCRMSCFNYLDGTVKTIIFFNKLLHMNSCLLIQFITNLSWDEFPS